MMKSRMARWFGVSLLVLATAACQQRQTVPEAPDGQAAPPPPYTIERLDQDIAVDASVRSVRIDNPHGTVVLKQTNAMTVGVHRVVQLIGEKPEAPNIRFERVGETIVLSVAYDSDRTLGVDTLVNGYRKGRVDVTVFVPVGPEVAVTTTYGDIQSRRINNDLTAQSRSGRIVGAGGGAMRLRNESGQIRAFPTTSKWTHPLEIDTGSGNILVQIREPVVIRFEAQTDGKILGWNGVKTDGKTSRLSFGDGNEQQEMRVRSKTGNIELVRVPEAYDGS